MLAYAANARPAGRGNSPTSLVLILAAHALVIGLLIQNKIRVDRALPEVIKTIPIAPPVIPPEPTKEQTKPQAPIDRIFIPPTPIPRPIPTDPITTTRDPGPVVINPVPGTAPVTEPYVPVRPAIPMPVKKSAVLLTSGDDLTPPYPDSRRDQGSETLIRLTLDIDARGRVVAVTPSGPADPVFLEAGRRHILRNWRYRPAMEDGRPVATRATISLLFRLED